MSEKYQHWKREFDRRRQALPPEWVGCCIECHYIQLVITEQWAWARILCSSPVGVVPCQGKVRMVKGDQTVLVAALRLGGPDAVTALYKSEAYPIQDEVGYVDD